MIDRYVEKFIRYLEIERNASKHTLINYSVDLKSLSEFLKEEPIEKVDYISLRRYLAHVKELNLSKVSIARKIASIRSFSICSFNINNLFSFAGWPLCDGPRPGVFRAKYLYYETYVF